MRIAALASCSPADAGQSERQKKKAKSAVLDAGGESAGVWGLDVAVLYACAGVVGEVFGMLAVCAAGFGTHAFVDAGGSAEFVRGFCLWLCVGIEGESAGMFARSLGVSLCDAGVDADGFGVGFDCAGSEAEGYRERWDEGSHIAPERWKV